jgi:hypothetical protein
LSIGRGPLNASVDLAGWTRVANVLPAVGAEARIQDGVIQCGRVVLGTAAASSWRPPPWPRNAEGERLTAALEKLERHAGEEAPADGLFRIVLGSAAGSASALARIARPRVAQLRQWVSARLARPVREPAPVDLLGLGPGLTPSGDDLLCGALVALHATGQAAAAHDLQAAIDEAAPSATTELSRAFLRAAAEGQGCEALHATIIALLENQLVASHLEVLARIGHTSGWDALAGAVLVLRAFGTTVGHCTGVARAQISL